MNKREEFLKDEDLRIEFISQQLKDWGDLEHRARSEYINDIKGLRKERRDILKYLGAISGGAAALAPQLLDKIHQLSLFYWGVGILSFILIFTVIYILSNIENESDTWLKELNESNEMFERIKKPKRDFLMNDNFSVEAFAEALSKGANEELPQLKLKIDESKKNLKGWFRLMDYTGEFITLLLVLGLGLISISLTDFYISILNLIYTIIASFIFINIVSAFPNKIFQYLGLPIDLVKSGVRWICKRE